MATITAPGGSASGTPARRVDPPARPLWQAPIFVLGVAVLVGMAVVRPFAPMGPAQRLARDLARSREILTRPDGNANEALELALVGLAPNNVDRFPDRVAEAAFLAGTAHVRLAEKMPPDRAAETWRRARQYLEQANNEHAERPSLSDDDQAKLVYRLGKVGFYTGDDLNRVIARLVEGSPRSDNPAEGYGLLATAYLNLNPPNLQKALEYNRKLRDEPDLTDAQLTAAKLVGGELLLRMGKPDEARQSLEMITDQAPPEVLSRARLLRARAHQDEKHWGDAAQLYKAILADTRVPVPEPAWVYYNLGLCYREDKQPTDAANAWQECVKLASGEESQAAAMVLAELHMLENAHERALEELSKAVAKVRSPADWHNPLMPKRRAIPIFERASETFRKAGRFELASKLIEPYNRLAPPLKVLVMRGETAAEWAAYKSLEARKPGTSPELEKEALALYVQAADAYSEAAGNTGIKPDEQGKYLWASALAYQSAKDPVKVMERLEKFITLAVEPEKLSEAYYHLGDIYLQNKDSTSARANFDMCVKKGENHFTHLARYQLAMMALGEGRVDEGLAALIENVNRLRYEDDPEALAQSLFALGDLWYQRKDYHGVCRTLEKPLGRFEENPKFKDNPEVTRARYQLADSYRQIAINQSQSLLVDQSMSTESRAHHQAQQRTWLQKAADKFAALDAYLVTEAGKDQLSPKQRADVPVLAAKCWFGLGEYDKAMAINDRLIARYPERLEGLEALGAAVQCHAARGQLEKVRQRLVQIELLLPKLPPDVRKDWEPWLAECVKQLKDLPPTTEGLSAR
jgi:tetratricopeptide (TPR) repeat protein